MNYFDASADEASPREHRAVGKCVAPLLAIHADAGAIAARIAEVLIDLEGTGGGIKIEQEEAVLTVLTGVEDEAAAARIGREPVRLLLFVERDARDLFHVRRAQVIDGNGMFVHQRSHPVVTEAERHAAEVIVEGA